MTQSKPHAQSLTPLKKRVFLAITIFFPVVFFLCLEVALRLFNYGPDLSLFKRYQIRGQTYYKMNPEVKFRYFGTSRFAPSTSPQCFQVPKPRGVYRIFCLGGSTTVGFPYYYNGSFPFYLQDRTKAAFPQKDIEVINLGMTATNSFTVLDMARELPDYEPDLIIVYDGHNEFYGALGVASQQTVGSLRFVALSYLRLIHLRTFMLLGDGIRKIAGLFGESNGIVSRGTMMETLARDRYVSSGSPLYVTAYRSFLENLEDLKKYCRSAGIPLILGTQVANLRDLAPFVSKNRPDVPPQQKALFHQLYSRGLEYQSNGKLDSAIAYFRSAIVLDSSYADVHYRLAQCLESIGSKKEALSEYICARDEDELRFRTDSKFNNLIRAMDDHEHCFVADIEAVFKSLSPDSLIGRDLIVEHLHPNARGHFIMARAYAQVMRQCGFFATREEWNAADTLNEDRLWGQRNVTELDDRMAAQTIHILTSGWPFSKGSPTRETIPVDDTLGQIVQKSTTDEVDWMKVHELAVAFYQRRADWSNVEREYKSMLTMAPLDLELYMNLAKLYLREKRFDDIADIMQSSLRIYPTVQAYRTLGDVRLWQGDAAGAAKFYERSVDLSGNIEERFQNGLALSLAYARSGQFEKSETHLREMLSINPNFPAAQQLLNSVRRELAKSASRK